MTGRLYGLGVGPGDPELLTLKAHRLLQSCKVIAFPAPDTGPSFARSIVEQFVVSGQVEYPIIIPMRTERFPAQAIYDEAAKHLAGHLEAGEDVAVLCEGDPFFYGSFMYLYERLAGRFDCEIVPGVSSIMAGAAALRRPLAARNDVLVVIPGPLLDEAIAEKLSTADAAVIIKVGRHFDRIRTLIAELGLTGHAGYLERVSLADERILPLSAATGTAPYFSMILVYKGAEDWVSSLPVIERDSARAGEEEVHNV
ncbi:precorrin-2 C(20)-methyltransferase [Hoeflea prorocentri]|uniref:Precorrin-2 C(20)-methyltransferase n=1 Tax=Hoeflea prorocentri TaxID=1922333 RepID=A0A9X3UJ47_9HYPH|nr:precorrin-2 C(20)-methyltransferase [Hoeflea prorocentri]MCY6381380.1 precorrin-2 C(20)-methyltransferase [Hoeflea prorocentri]MDA5399180.1 precorrin-2 C(20)-methyltransferase [Hoeflea prorocentri]